MIPLPCYVDIGLELSLQTVDCVKQNRAGLSYVQSLAFSFSLTYTLTHTHSHKHMHAQTHSRTNAHAYTHKHMLVQTHGIYTHSHKLGFQMSLLC